MTPDDIFKAMKTDLSHEADYDPAARRLRYLRDRELKGRQIKARAKAKARDKKVQEANKERDKAGELAQLAKMKGKKQKPVNNKRVAEIKDRISSIKGRLGKLQERLRELKSNAKSKSSSSDEKTAAEKSKASRDAKAYREKHKAEIAQKRKAKSESEGGSKSIGSMSESEVNTAINKALVNLKKAMQELKSTTSSTA